MDPPPAKYLDPGSHSIRLIAYGTDGTAIANSAPVNFTVSSFNGSLPPAVSMENLLGGFCNLDLCASLIWDLGLTLTVPLRAFNSMSMGHLMDQRFSVLLSCPTIVHLFFPA